LSSITPAREVTQPVVSPHNLHHGAPDHAVARVADVSYIYPGGTTALRAVNLDVGARRVTALIGPSGSGKSTLLRLLNGLLTPTAGSVRVTGIELTRATASQVRFVRRSVGMVFQQFNLIRRLSAFENVLVGRLGYLPLWRSTLKRYPAADVEIAIAALARVGMAEQAWSRADALSGGQQQRVGIARALAQRPRLILADEPIASLDPKNAGDVMRLLRRIHEEDGIPILVSLHQMEAVAYADWVVGLRRGEVAFAGPPAALTETMVQHLYYDDGHGN